MVDAKDATPASTSKLDKLIPDMNKQEMWLSIPIVIYILIALAAAFGSHAPSPEAGRGQGIVQSPYAEFPAEYGLAMEAGQ